MYSDDPNSPQHLSEWAKHELQEMEMHNPGMTMQIHGVEHEKMALELEEALKVAYAAADAKPPNEKILEAGINDPRLQAIAKQVYDQELQNKGITPEEALKKREEENQRYMETLEKSLLGMGFVGAGKSAEVAALDPKSAAALAAIGGKLNGLRLNPEEVSLAAELHPTEKLKNDNAVFLNQRRSKGFTIDDMNAFVESKKEKPANG